jgi:hypothetical protein
MLTPEELDELAAEEELLEMREFRSALLGLGRRCGLTTLVYDRDEIVRLLTREMTEEEAEEHIAYNIEGGYVGPGTPILLERLAPERMPWPFPS